MPYIYYQCDIYEYNQTSETHSLHKHKLIVSAFYTKKLKYWLNYINLLFILVKYLFHIHTCMSKDIWIVAAATVLFSYIFQHLHTCNSATEWCHWCSVKGINFPIFQPVLYKFFYPLSATCCLYSKSQFFPNDIWDSITVLVSSLEQFVVVTIANSPLHHWER